MVSPVAPAVADCASMSAEGGKKAVVAAMTANLAIAIAKFVAWIFTGASSMLAEAIHSVADTSNQILLLLGGRSAAKEADELHPFGYGRSRYISAFMVAIILFSLGGLFALYEAYHKFHSWHAGEPDKLLESPLWWVPIVVLVFALIAEGRSLSVAVRESRPAKGRQSWARFIKTAKSPELPVILLEDLAALLGLVFALLGVSLAKLTHNGIFDVIGTALIGLLLIAVAVILAAETRSLLLGEAATPEQVVAIKDALTATDGVEQVIHLKTLHLGPEELLVAAKIGVDAGDSAQLVAQIIDRAEQAVRAAQPMVTACYLEPDVFRGDCQPAARPERPHAPSH